MVVRRDGDSVVSRHTFDARHTGAPGVAHGGAVAAAFDDLFGFVLYLVGELAVTRNLSVDYLAPVRLAIPYELRATYEQRSGRRLPVTASMARVDDGTVAATATATFVVVDIEHFHRAALGDPAPQPGKDVPS
jgi:acyl-coenzyme A thioesterase PaaI-like protein